MNDKQLLAREDLKDSRKLFEAACHYSRMYGEVSREYLIMYGDHGPDVSGCVRSHFPEQVKDHLRELSRRPGLYSQKAFDARPRGTRTATLKALGKAVARRDGSGFYGPQA